MELAGVGPKEATEALAQHKEVWLAVDALLKKPETSGEKYIPSKPVVDSGIDAEQRERCQKGRWLQDKVNAVFSVAHSKIRNQLGDQEEAPAESSETTVPVIAEVSTPAS